MTSESDETNFLELIPELKDWKGPNGEVNVDTWIGCKGSYEHLVGYGQIFWPRFMEFDDCLFFKGRFTEENYRTFMSQTGNDKGAVEAVMNHVHITDIFYNTEPKPTRDMVIYIGRLLKDVWQTKLNHDFPSRRVVVSFPEEPREDLLHYEITLFQER
jgi:hypothetical protein